jgi:hypothetical protein
MMKKAHKRIRVRKKNSRKNERENEKQMEKIKKPPRFRRRKWYRNKKQRQYVFLIQKTFLIQKKVGGKMKIAAIS